MAKSFPLQIMLDLLLAEVDQAAKVLALANIRRLQKEKEIDDLYVTRRACLTANLIKPYIWQIRNSQYYVDMLDCSIADNQNTLEEIRTHVSQCQHAWQQKKNELKKFEILHERHLATEAIELSRLNRKEEDAISAHFYLQRRYDFFNEINNL